VLAANDEKEYSGVMTRAAREKVPVHMKELEHYHATHADIGAYLLGLWGLPDEIISSVERHHTLGSDLGKKFSPVLCVHVAQNLVPEPDRLVNLNEAYLKECKLGTRIPLWEEALNAEVAPA